MRRVRQPQLAVIPSLHSFTTDFSYPAPLPQPFPPNSSSPNPYPQSLQCKHQVAVQICARLGECATSAVPDEKLAARLAEASAPAVGL